ncbi:MAG: flagellar basal body-associated FliL family protein [Halieaceae bacterium]|nr:flagellar basal body-associated FliL family protein [Halieaceae bacterium]
MAKKDDLNLGKGDKRGKGDEDGDATEGGGKKKLIIIAVAVLVLLGGGGAAAFFLLGGDPEEGDEAVVVEVEEEEAPEPLYLDIKKLLVNIQHEGNTHYVQAEMQLMAYDDEVLQQALRDRPAIRNGLIMLFNSQDFEALKSVEGKEALRKAALRSVNKTLGLKPPKAVQEVYFESFVLQ